MSWFGSLNATRSPGRFATHAETGKQLRLRRLSLAGDDRHLLIPLDHSVSDGPIVPAAKWDDLLRALAAGGADGIITGVMRDRFAAREQR
jgi:2-amino-4,5-dihydroxy-6-oxo-7-(phosphooxy)heptanoate synthase